MQDQPGRHLVVPTRPGPLEPLRAGDAGRRDEIDDVLDDLFGAPDERGPNAADAVLIVGGGAMAALAVARSWSGGLVALGVAVAVIGLVLPIRAAWRAVTQRRRLAATSAQLAGGVPLRTEHPAVVGLVGAYRAVWDAAGSLEERDRIRVGAAAHAAVHEVATLLRGRSPATAGEVEYVTVRRRALAELAATAAAGNQQERLDAEARVQARHDVESVGGSSVAEVAALIDELRGGATTEFEHGEARGEPGV